MFSLSKAALKKIYYSLFLVLTFALISAKSPIQDNFQSVLAPPTAENERVSEKEKVSSSEKLKSRAFATFFEHNELLSVNLATGEIDQSHSLNFPAKILALSPDGRKIYLADRSTQHLLKMNLESKKMERVNGPEGIPHRLIIGPNGEKGYATYEGNKEIVCLDFKNRSFLDLVSLEGIPHGITFDKTKNKLFVSFKESSDIVSVDIHTSAITPFAALNFCPDDLGLSKDGESLYIVQRGGQQIEVVDIQTKHSQSIAFDSASRFPDGHSAVYPDVMIAYGTGGSVYLARDQGSEIFDINTKTQMAHSVIAFSNPISSIAFLPELELQANGSVIDELALRDESGTRAQKREMSLSAVLTPTTTALMSSPDPSDYGQTITLTATVTPSAASGTVTFKDGASAIGSGTLSGGVVSINVSNLTVSGSPHSLSAVYGGDSTHDGSTSSIVNQVVNQSTPTIAVASNLNPSTYGDNLTITATVTAPSPYTGVPTGTVTFTIDGNPTAPVNLSPSTSTSSKATYSINTLTGGNHLVTATYNGDSNFIAAFSFQALTQTVNQGTTTTSIISLSQSPTEYGQPITLQAIVVGSVNNPPFSPGGTVNFYADPGAVLLTTSIITAAAGTNTASVTGTYTPPPFLDVGSYTLYAQYVGDVNYIGSTSSPSSTISQQILQTATTTKTTFQTTCGNNVKINLIATVTANPPGAGTPVGSVEFYDGFTLLGTQPLISGVATFPAILSAGNHSITSIYIPNANFTGSTAPPVSITASKDNTSISFGFPTVTSFGSSVNMVADVIPACSSIIPTGTVTFYNNSTVLGTVPLINGHGSFSICNIYPAIFPNSNSITVTYSGDANFNGSTSFSTTLTVLGTLNTTTTITASSENPVAVDPDTTVFTATVKAVTACSNLVVTGGSVDFFDSTTMVPLGSSSLINGTAQSAPFSFAQVGTHNIIATYNDNPGQSRFITSTSVPFAQCVTPYDTALALTLIPAQTDSQEAIVTATVTVLPPGPFTPPGPIPDFDTSGIVEFYDGADLIASIPVPANSNTTFSVSIPVACFGCPTVTAVYSGETCGNFDTSLDTISTALVAPSETSVTVAVEGSAPYYFCQPITFTASVAGTCSNGGCTPTGTVTFFDGTMAIGTAILNDAGTATLEVSTLSLGAHSISATYNSDSFFAFAVSTNSVNLTIVAAPTTTTLTILPAAGSVYGQTLIFGAQVTSPAGIPTTGSVSFSDENGTFATVPVDASGKASYATTQIGGGTHTFTATYSSDCCSTADACFQGSLDSQTGYVISKVLPKLNLTGTPQTVTYGDVITLKATVDSYSVGVPTGTVSFYVGSTFLGTAAITDGIASLQVSNYLSHVNIPVGNAVIFNATYSGDASFLNANFPQWIETINKAAVVVSLFSESPNPAFYGKTVNLTATVESLLSIPTNSGNTPVGIPPTGTVTFVIDGSPGPTVALTNGIATYSSSTLSVGGPHTIIAKYNGDANFLTNSSPTYNQQIEKIDTQITVISSANPSTYNTSPTFSVTVASAISGQGTPTGTITASYGSYSTGAISLSGSGTATFTIPNLQAGIDTIAVKYLGNANFNASSTVYSQTVNPAPTTTVASSSVNPSVFGQPVTLTATVSSAVAGTLTGTVQFFDGSTQIGIAAVSGGAASITLNNLSVGTHPITMVYSGGGNFAASQTSAPLSQVVSLANTTTILTSSFNSPFSYGEAVTFTANVIPTSPGSGIPSGSIQFFDGVNLIGTANLGIGGIASFTPSATTLNAGIHSISAKYVPDIASNFSGSTSSPVSQTVNPAATITTVWTPSAFNPSGLGGPGSINVTVNAVDTGLVVPDGTVQAFYAGSAISPLVNVSTAVNGVISVPVTLPVGSTAGAFPIVVTYTPGNSPQNFTTSSGALDQLVNKSNVNLITLTSSVNPSFFGEAVTFTATVTPSAATGTISFYDGTALIAVQSMAAGVSTFTTSNLTVGSHPITAVYSGDATYSTASATLVGNPQVVKPGVTTTILTSSVAMPEVGQETVLTATVTANGPAMGTPTGTVTFSGTGISLPVTVNLVGGIATLPISFATAGLKNLTATYNGDSNFLGSSGNLPLLVTSSATTTVLASSVNPSQVGQNTILTAAVSAQAPGSGTPTGTVTFSGSGITTVTVPLVNGVATAPPVSFATTGNYLLTATYNGDLNFSGSSGNLTQQVLTADTTTTLTTNPYTNPSVFGQSITLQATVNTGTGSVPLTGTVNFYEGSLLLGTGSVSGGVATLPISTLDVDLHLLTVFYSGDSNYASSTSPEYTQIVNKGLTATTLISSVNPSTYGQNVTFTATVTVNSPAAGTPAGTVNFIENGMVIGTGILSEISPFTASITLSDLTVSTLSPYHQITAEYVGDDHFNSSTSMPVGQKVTPAPTATTIVSHSPNPSMFGELVTFVATTVSDPAILTDVIDLSGTIEFFDAPNPANPATWILLGTVPTNGLAIFETDQLTLAPFIPHNIIAVYSGDTNYLTSTSPPVQQTVNETSQTNTTVTKLTSTPNPSQYGCPVTFNIQVVPLVIPDPYPGPPTGSVSLYLGTQSLTPLALTLDSTGKASVTIPHDSIPVLPAGLLTIVALYSGDANYSSSTTTLNQIVNLNTTTLALTSSANPSLFSESVTFTATLKATVDCPPSVELVPTGTVSFYDGVLPGGILLGTSPIDGNGVSTFTTNDLLTGSHTITAVYNPDANFETAKNSLVQVVQCIPTLTEIITAAPNPSVLGDTVTLFAGVSINPTDYTGNESGPPIGSVTFYDTFNGVGPTPIGTVLLANGFAILNMSNLSIGTHNITAQYSGSDNFCSSELAAPGYQQVVLVPILPTNTVVTSSINPAEFGTNVIFTATVTDPSLRGIPTGTVTFFDGDVAIGTAILVNGIAQISDSTLSIGSHPIIAIYSGEPKYMPSTSEIYTQVIIASTYPLPPHDFYGCQVINKFLNFDEIVNVLTWQPPQNDNTIVRYEIYRNAALTKLAGVVKNRCPYRFEDNDRKKKRTYTYYIVSVNAEGKKSPAVETKVIPHNKKKR